MPRCFDAPAECGAALRPASAPALRQQPAFCSGHQGSGGGYLFLPRALVPSALALPYPRSFSPPPARLPTAQVEREMEVSHWGAVSVHERIWLRHAGARHAGTWSRLDYQRAQHIYGASSFREVTASLPRETLPSSLYFRDEIGNISTSQYRLLPERVRSGCSSYPGFILSPLARLRPSMDPVHPHRLAALSNLLHFSLSLSLYEIPRTCGCGRV